MKAERRRELKTNTLAMTLENLPLYWQQYGTKILIGIVAILAIVLFVRSQMASSRRQQVEAEEAYVAARGGVDTLRAVIANGFRDPRAAAAQRAQLQEEVEKRIELVLQDSKNEVVQAEALVTRGDLNWYLATAPDFTSTQTQPSTRPSADEEKFLDRAQQAYDSAIRIANANPLTVATARFGLAAIAEQRQKWDEANAAYEAIINDPKAEEAFKKDATERQAALAIIRKPVLLGKPATNPFAEPATTRTTTTTTTTSPATTSTTTRPATTKAAK